MKKLITLNEIDVNELTETIEYFLSDDKEMNDFLDRYREMKPNEYEKIHLIDDYGNLDLDATPKELRNHIFYRLQYLNQQLRENIYG